MIENFMFFLRMLIPALAFDWVEFQTEQESIEQVVKTEIDADENGIEDEDDKEKIQAGILLDEQYQNTYCAVCGDKFEQIWDEEDESWKFSNAVTVNDKVYHTFCRGEEQDSPPREDDDSQSSSSDMRIKSEPDQGDYDVFSTTQAAAQPSFISPAGGATSATSIPLLGSTTVDTALLNSVLSAVKNLPLIKKETPAPLPPTQIVTSTAPVLINNFDSIMKTLRTLNSGDRTMNIGVASNFDPNRVKIEADDSMDESIVVKNEPED